MNKYINRLGIVLTFLIIGMNTYSQDPVEVKVSQHKVIIDGHVYFIHVVKPGQTLYSISRAYKVREKDIALENPGVYSGLQIGQLLKIPAEVPEFVDDEFDQPIDTIKFFPHYLQESETIFSLSRQYNISVTEIEKANPDLDYNDLPVGQLILIPRYSITREDVEFILHKVRRKETLFSLSRKYEVEISDIERFNPEVAITGLKNGQTIKIPRYKTVQPVMASDSTSVGEDSLYAEVPQTEFEYIDPVPMNEYYRKMKNFDRNELNVSYMLPFDYYQEPEEIDSARLEEADREKENGNVQSAEFLEFFEGSLLAIERLKKEGVNVNVKYYDTRKSPTRVREILSSDGFQGTNIIIGPYEDYNIEIVSAYSRENGIPLVLPFYESEELTLSNPYLFQLNPSYKVEYRTIASILADEYDKNFVFVYSSDSLKMPEIEYLKNSLVSAVSTRMPEENFSIKEIVYDNVMKANISEDMKLAFSEEKTNIVVIPEKNEAFVSSVVQQLYFLYLLNGYKIEIFGKPHFSGFYSIEYKYYFDLNLRYLTPYYYSYSDTAVNDFLKEFRKYFKSEPEISTDKGYPFAFAGYDVSYFFIKSMSSNGKDFVLDLNFDFSDEVIIPFRWKKQSDMGGFENYNLKLVEFVDGYGFKVRDVSRIPFQRTEVRNPWNNRFND